MPAASPSLNSFNAGEFSPLMMGQTNFEKWSSGVKSMLNFIPRSQGPAERRAGTYFVSEIKDSGSRVWLAKFEFNTTQAFILEFGPQYIRFYSDHGVALNSSGGTLEVVSPYTADDLTNDDGGFGLSMVQSGDVIYICCHTGNTVPYKLSRNSNTDWTLEAFDYAGALGPFDSTNSDRTKTVYTDQFRIWSSDGADRPDGTPTTTNYCTITANAAIFESGHVGGLFYIESSTDKVDDATGHNGYIPCWQSGTEETFAPGVFCRSDGKYYESMDGTKTGATQPDWTAGAHQDGYTLWRYSNGGWGVIQITSVTSSSVAVGKILQELPPSVRNTTGKTYKYAFGDWSPKQGFPTKVAFYKNRLVFAARGKLWFSVASDYENFTPMADGYEVQDDDAINVQIEADSTNTVQWLAPGSSLLIGTAGAEHSCAPSTTTSAFGPKNIQITKESAYGSTGVNSVQVGATSMFVQRAGCKVRAVQADYESGSYSSSDLTVLAEHITRAGVVDMAWQQEPDYVLWVVLADGSLVAMTYNDEQKVTAWHRHDVDGDVEAVGCIPDPNGIRDDLWLVVKRTINGATRRYVEYLHAAWDAASESFSQAYYVDCGLTYSGDPVTSVSGLSHLEGETVSIITDGAAHPEQTVSNGSVSLNWSSSVVHVGLSYSSEIVTLPLEAGGSAGTSQGKTKRISKLTLRFVNTLGGKAGLEGGSYLDILESRSYSDLMDNPPSPFTDDRNLPFPSGYDTNACIRVVQDQPLPMTLVAIYPRSWTTGE
ncbi:hypothetical protein N5580_13080 [Pantoea piersonii]|uniref:Uncharacterized protein n=1 Tax=Pantoea piersonii TaxID=2364647 RepID=A0AAJ5U8M7_9GAMM|nr:hypothetical protein [Pantoea piersonii]WBG90021.1 hypothetical protein N5580_13080 [Pantoea piersonii]